MPSASVLLSAIASVSWAFLAMAGTAALGLHLLGADAAGSLGPMTAAVVAMAAGGRVSPSGDVAVFGLDSAGTTGAIGVMPLGVSLVGALLLTWVFLRSLRGAGEPGRSREGARATEPPWSGAVVPAGELAARVIAVAALFTALLGGLAWAGQDTIAIDGASLGAPTGGGLDLPGIGDIGGGLTDGLKGLIKAKTSVGFHVDTVPTLLRGLVWVLAVLLIALLGSRRTPLPPGWQAVHRVVRPAVSALCAVLVLAVVAGFAAAGYAAVTGKEPGRIMGAALLGAPNGVWLAVPLGLFVQWKGAATGELAKLLPDPIDRLLSGGLNEPITPGRLAELDHRVWLLPVAAALMMLTAGVLAATRTPVGTGPRTGYVGRCALRLGVAAAVAFPLLVWLTGISVNANLSVFGFDAVGAGIDLHGSVPVALLLGAAWGAGAGGVGALLALATGAAGRRAAPLARGGAPGAAGGDSSRTYPDIAYEPGPYLPGPAFHPDETEPNPYKLPSAPGGGSGAGAGGDSPHAAPTVAGAFVPPPLPRRPQGRARPDKWPDPPGEPPPPPGRPGGRR
ncbi:streptophobe family protein [Streptomyces sp. H10-C2]|uniref:streptophobe family protein n=1 Tax=unclassified Streptomyces TaxID=2593676 RepID=UPI0024B98A26|nr:MULTISPECIES: streptophobe family protein [unclassified Streptomyces]MDJ0344870.1 streptophobe family protein [Streptomyces sp. PH10-H1]MDJ0371930.1 streptophobe family protein [Streptomyces sp. H10-C2]